MCLDCGCHKLNDDHGNPDHITLDKLQRAARASGIEPELAASNIGSEARKVRDQAGMSR